MRPWAIFVDVVGLGAGVYDRCKELGLPVRAVNVGEAASSRDSTGKMVVESKANIKKRGMRSPDLADAFLLTFAYGDKRKVEYHGRPIPRHSGWAA